MNLPTRATVLDIHDLRFAYAPDPPLVANWSHAIGPGVTLLYGETGSGKSTLLRVLSGNLAAQGRLALAGTDARTDPAGYRRHVFFVDPTTDVFDQVTGLACTATLREGDAAFDESRWQSLVDGFGLLPHIEKPMYMLSTGSKRKVWLAAALGSSRPLLLFDEPTSALDAGSVRRLWEAIAQVAAQPGRAVLIGSYERIDRVPLAATIELP
ncbi:ABC transporter ATP-binding protein [Variovorax sp. PAMC 28711]|uniref:ABC transporter ATP-binding protein n=1 Tax=Variovorax sp. PAMC 28711 TaxID=1795631 RepID=UPI00078D179F|nr:ATP-binding cassette domain-containing protein [Variovorax sp. PAMC 28711]AMM26385.1 ABC transporter [Variovorax sp. PAMC 28711]